MKVQEGLFGKQCCNFEFLISSSQSIDLTAKFKHSSAPFEEKESYTGRPDIFNVALTNFNSAVQTISLGERLLSLTVS